MDSSLRVINKRHYPRLPVGAVMVDRRTPFGNPFVIGPDGDRQAVIEKYRRWIFREAQAELRKKIRAELQDKILVCHCKPLDCHADILLEIANGGGEV